MPVEAVVMVVPEILATLETQAMLELRAQVGLEAPAEQLDHQATSIRQARFIAGPLITGSLLTIPEKVAVLVDLAPLALEDLVVAVVPVGLELLVR